jgi:hypothetical protein
VIIWIHYKNDEFICKTSMPIICKIKHQSGSKNSVAYNKVSNSIHVHCQAFTRHCTAIIWDLASCYISVVIRTNYVQTRLAYCFRFRTSTWLPFETKPLYSVSVLPSSSARTYVSINRQYRHCRRTTRTPTPTPAAAAASTTQQCIISKSFKTILFV